MKIAILPAVKTWYFNAVFVHEPDGRTDYYIRLKSDLSSRGVTLSTLDDYNERYDFIIVHRIDVNLKRLYSYLKINPQCKIIYFITEEPSIVPFHKRFFLRLFGFNAVIGYSKPFKNHYLFTYPNPVLTFSKGKSFENRDLVCAIASNKPSTYSKHGLYRFRRTLFKKLANNKQFHLYGRGWENCKNYGAPFSKSEVLKNYRFSIVIENSITRGFVTEKIFDVMANGCVPIYHGATEIADLLPTDTYIELKDNVISQLEKIDESTWLKYQDEISKFMSSEAYLRHTEIQFSKLVIDVIENSNQLKHSPSRLRLFAASLTALILNPRHLLNKSGRKFFLDIITIVIGY